ncbi:non-ribosomal peptide synthetase family protein [Flavobacterium algicola]|uniref:non-ribosomal peptide synthetase family protein n=1 Tax=Flavobacterium algicola TaxID=556529 RepID=UPI001EFC5DB1|nr:amino acid adenylation domain-containing protein [Flavobacterium algicola]MCG9793501.1 amino acid adenylation domain-containing protein [Flavobacterium algicola]
MEQLYTMISGRKLDYPKTNLHKLFADQAVKLPHAIAIEFDGEKITYSELSEKINKTANYLWDQGLRPGQIVTVSLERSPELIISLFAILQCGASYVPVDTKYPEARLNVIFEDAAAVFHIGVKPLKSSTIKFIKIDTILNAISAFSSDFLNIEIAPESPAYVIYTSGSTGKPKGVQVAHYNAINLLFSMAIEPGIDENDKIFSVTTISFDAMVMEIYLPLLFGACIVLVNEDTRLDGKLLLEKAIEENITIIWGTPSIWQILLDSGWEKPLKIKALIGGESVPIVLAQKLLSLCDELWNIYGPTETTVCSFLTKIDLNDDPIHIGKPIANTKVYLLDKNKNPVNDGEVGEIVIAGDGVSLGYLNNTKLTNERFLANPFDPYLEGKIYFSGDLGKLLPNGNLQCLGRIDHQVKVRGYRIEIEEIEHVLLSNAFVKSAVVLVKEQTLVALIVPMGESTEYGEYKQLLKNYLNSQLPDYMVPQIFYIIDKIPTTINGKIDRKELVAYTLTSEVNKTYNAPKSEEEKLVATIWKENLNLDTIDIQSNFFELGGHSIKAVKIISDIEKHTGKRISLSTLFDHATVEKFAKLMHTDSETYADCIVPLKANGSKTPIFMIHGGGLNVLSLVNMSKHFNDDQPFYGIQGVGPRGYDHWYQSVEEMASHYVEAIVKVNPKGPYALVGFCIGGVVAFEMTRQLKQQGREVCMTAVLDSYVDSAYYYKNTKHKKLIRTLARTSRRARYFGEMLVSRKAFKKRITEKKEYLLKKHLEKDTKSSEQEILAHQQFVTAVSLVNTILDRYHLKPQPFKIDLIRSKDHPAHTLAPTHLGWKKAATEGISIHHIPGDNFDIRESPHDKNLAKIIQGLVDKVILFHLNFLFIFETECEALLEYCML